MRVIKPPRIREYCQRHGRAKSSLERWLSLARGATWHNLVDVQKTFPSAEEVKVGSGRKVVIFNIGGNSYRLITAVHYDRGKVFVLRFLTHAEYSKDQWKGEL